MKSGTMISVVNAVLILAVAIGGYYHVEGGLEEISSRVDSRPEESAQVESISRELAGLKAEMKEVVGLVKGIADSRLPERAPGAAGPVAGAAGKTAGKALTLASPDSAGQTDRISRLLESEERKSAALAKRIDQLASDLESAKSSISQLRSGEERVEEGKALALDNRHAFHAIMEEEKATDPEAYAKSQEYYERGLKELAQGGEPGALEELISAHPESNRASCAAMQLSAHYMKNGRLDEAEHYLDFATEFGAGAMFKDGVEVYPQSLFYMGLLARKRGDPELAKTYWKTALENHPYALMHSGRTLEEVISDESAYKQQ